MTEEGLREKLFSIVSYFQYKTNRQDVIDEIFDTFREAGYKSGEEVQELQDKIDWFYERDAGASL